LRQRLSGQRVDLEAMDVVDANAEDVRFLQATRHGEVSTPVELVEGHARDLADKTDPVLERLREGESLGIALVHEKIPEPIRKKLLSHFVSEDLANCLDRHYVLDAAGDHDGALKAEKAVDDTLAGFARRRQIAQKFGAFALVPFIGMLVWLRSLACLHKKPSETRWGQTPFISHNLASTFLCCRAVTGVMKDQHSGAIINISSHIAFSGSENRAPLTRRRKPES
jgi:NAD(P)-dependent dehydrogenase (short-subunit alcohol dehydrogenase family)